MAAHPRVSRFLAEHPKTSRFFNAVRVKTKYPHELQQRKCPFSLA
jgi:hypothetical protein